MGKGAAGYNDETVRPEGAGGGMAGRGVGGKQ